MAFVRRNSWRVGCLVHRIAIGCCPAVATRVGRADAMASARPTRWFSCKSFHETDQVASSQPARFSEYDPPLPSSISAGRTASAVPKIPSSLIDEKRNEQEKGNESETIEVAVEPFHNPIDPVKKKNARSKTQEVQAPFVLEEKDLEEWFARGSGPGGQKVNKTSNKVHLRHIPTGITVTCHEQRDLKSNRRIARRKLQELIDLRIRGQDSKLAMREKRLKRRKYNAKRRSKKKYGAKDEEIDPNSAMSSASASASSDGHSTSSDSGEDLDWRDSGDDESDENDEKDET